MININKVSIELGGKQIITDYSEQIPGASITVILGPETNPALTPASQLAKLRAMAIQSQNYTLGFTVKQIIEMAGDSKEIIEAFSLTQLADRQVTTLSGGEAQRVSIATAIAQNTPVLLLDEPLAAQDLENRERIIKLLQKLAASGTTVVLVAHSSESELTWADKVINLYFL